MLRAIAAAKKKNDKIDASKIADCLRCDFLPECHMASTEIRNRRRTLRYRNLLIKQMVQMKNRVSGLLMETGGATISSGCTAGYFTSETPRRGKRQHTATLQSWGNDAVRNSIMPGRFARARSASEGRLRRLRTDC